MQFFNKNGHPQNISVSHEGKEISKCCTAKFLGFDVDSKLMWKDHISSVCQKINRFTYALYRLTNISSQGTALTAYHGYVCSALRYGLILWGNSVDANRVFLIQKKCVRAICGAGPMDSCRPLFKKLNLLTLPCMYIYEICVFTKANLKSFQKKNETCKFTTRYPNRLVIPKSSTTLFQKNVSYMSVRVFNKLPDILKDLPLKKFKFTLNKLLCDKCFYSIDEFMNYKFK